MSYQLIPAHCRICSLKANVVSLNTPMEEPLPIFTLCMPCFVPFEGEKKIFFFQKQNPQEQLQGANLIAFKHH